ncbi:peptidoglycan recognition protein 5 [Myripristis murdjan]|uniref:Peptidoglycan recognition protein 5 n=1 Tax=Myripristis murdjan TaxID=586833 RepID=A0A667XF79_9TELE|nr:peptidoglycan-recognition protein SC2-like [Myripristis murdjan]
MAETVNVVSRQQWGAVAPHYRDTMKDPAKRVVIHHTAITSQKGSKECMAQLVSIQRTHITERKFDDIGYNFLVAQDGTVYEGRGWGVVGAHAKSNNHDSVGIALMGNYNNETPSSEALSSVKKLLQSGVSQKHLKPEFVLLGHKDLGKTECPGEKLYACLKNLT